MAICQATRRVVLRPGFSTRISPRFAPRFLSPSSLPSPVPRLKFFRDGNANARDRHCHDPDHDRPLPLFFTQSFAPLPAPPPPIFEKRSSSVDRYVFDDRDNNRGPVESSTPSIGRARVEGKEGRLILGGEWVGQPGDKGNKGEVRVLFFLNF